MHFNCLHTLPTKDGQPTNAMHFKCFWEIPKRRPVFFPTARLKIKGSNGITATKEGRPTTVATFPNPSNWPKCTGATQGSLARLFGVNSEDIIPNFPSFQKLKSLNSKGVPQIKTKHATSILVLHTTEEEDTKHELLSCPPRVLCVFPYSLLPWPANSSYQVGNTAK